MDITVLDLHRLAEEAFQYLNDLPELVAITGGILDTYIFLFPVELSD